MLLAAVLLTVASLLAYGRTFSAPFIFDDLPGIVRNPTIRALWPLDEVLFPSQASGTGVDGRPIVNLSLALNYAMGGLEVRGYRIFNLAGHVATAVLLFALLRRTWNQPALRDRYGIRSKGLALGASLAWTLHPLQTESVACVIQRTEVFVGFFYVLTLLAFVRAAEGSGRGRRGWETLTVAACLLGMLTKEVMVTAPVVVLLYDRTFLAGSFVGAWRARRRLYCALALTWVPLLWLVVASGGRAGTVGFETGANSWTYLLTQAKALTIYLQLSIWPFGLVLDYGMAMVRDLGEVLLQLLFVVSLAGVTIWAVWRRPIPGFAGACFFIVLAPSSSVVPLVTQTIAEHRMYLPLAALLALAVATLHRCWARCSVATTVVLALGLGMATWQRNAVFATPVAIWADTVQKAPENARAHYNYANALAEAGRVEEAAQSYADALRLKPRYGAAHYNYAGALLQLGRASEAIVQYQAALRLNPNAADTHANLAAALIREGRVAEAVTHYEAAARLGMLAAEENRRFGRALAEIGRVDEALVRLEEAVRLVPRDGESRMILGMVLAAAGRRTEAVKHFTEAVLLDPNDAGARCALGDALVETRPAEALAHYEAALRLQPRQAVIHTSIGNAQALLGRVAEAIAHYEAALRLDPNAAEARANLQHVRSTAIRRGLIRP